MAAAVPALVIGATAVSATGAIAQSGAASEAHQYNAGLMEQGATVERQQASQREETQRRQSRLLLGKQRAALAQSGIGSGGSAADVYQRSVINSELDALTIRYEGDLRARGLKASAEGERFAGNNAKRMGYFKAANSILSGTADYMSL